MNYAYINNIEAALLESFSSTKGVGKLRWRNVISFKIKELQGLPGMGKGRRDR